MSEWLNRVVAPSLHPFGPKGGTTMEDEGGVVVVVGVKETDVKR